jgi:hypothetical protein
MIDKIRGTLPPIPVHPHVQRPILAKGEPPFCVIQLTRGQTQVHQNPIHFFDAKSQYDLPDLAEIGRPQENSVAKGFQDLARKRQSTGVGIQSHEPAVRVRGDQNALRVSTSPERGIDVPATRVGPKPG